MTKAAFWKADWFLGLVFAILLLFASNSRFFQSVERASDGSPSAQVAVIAIDDQSIANIGRWPWPRDIHLRLIDPLVIGHLTLDFESKRQFNKAQPVYDHTSAHNPNVRDLEPANITWDPVADSVKVTDLGIARITDSSQIKSEMVLGTPSYMSPEHLAGKKIDGHSDLFSLSAVDVAL
ncbi:MAG: protein kinase domain-containing protein [Burkholderiales bacterium]